MKKVMLTVSTILFWVSAFHAHDMFLKLGTFFLKPKAAASISLLNGTFERSENAITRDRMIDVTIAGPEHEKTHPDTSQWRDVDMRTVLDFETGDPGTYVVGTSTAARMIELSAQNFNEYLEHDGVLDILALRNKQNELGKDARERYSKHVKAIFQVGEKRSAGFSVRLGYPLELVPLQNPYDLRQGDTMQVLILKDSQPVANQLIYASYESFHEHKEEREHRNRGEHAGKEEADHREAVQTRTDKNGVAKFVLEESGRWYIRIIHMQKVDEEGADYESIWATLTFEVL
ncbi:MAG: DUF4198 domain-containing protein [bacterium]